jgi:hypothetical protein
MIDPANFDANSTIDPDTGITVSSTLLAKLFSREKPPIGFETQHLPPGIVRPPMDEDMPMMDDEFADMPGMPGMPGMMGPATGDFDTFDPVALGLHDGSLIQQLAYNMQQEVDMLRTT